MNHLWLDVVADVATVAPYEQALRETLETCLSDPGWLNEPEFSGVYPFLAVCWVYPELQLLIRGNMAYWDRERRATFESCLAPYLTHAQNGIDDKPHYQTATELLAEKLPERRWMIEGLMHEGLILFGGKSKRGKSYLALDLAMAMAAGRSAFGHPDFAVRAKRRVLYIALEDGKGRIQERLRKIQPNIETLDTLAFSYTWPLLTQGGMGQLEAAITEEKFDVIVLDILARVEGAPPGKGDRDYHEVYDLFASLQTLRSHHSFTLLMLTHLRKQDAEDVFDTLHGSVAYAGAQDVLWVLERKPNDDVAVLHLRDKDAEDLSIAIQFKDGCWHFLGEGEEHVQGQAAREIIQALREEERPLSIREIMQCTGMPQSKYAQVRKTLSRLAAEDLILRVDRGRYAIGYRAMHEQDVPF